MPEEERIQWTKRNLAIRMTGPHVVECLEKYGYDATLHQLVVLSTVYQDKYLEEYLALFPTVCVLRDFLKKIPVYDVDEETFEYLMKQGGIL